MAAGDSISGDQVTIWIESAGVLGTALAASVNKVQAEVLTFNVEGGDLDYEIIPVFGGGNITKKKPRSELEISMDVILRYNATEATAKKWDLLGISESKKCIIIEASDGTNYQWYAFNNARALNFNKEFEAENELRGTISFKVAPTEPDNTNNFKFGGGVSTMNAEAAIENWTDKGYGTNTYT